MKVAIKRMKQELISFLIPFCTKKTKNIFIITYFLSLQNIGIKGFLEELKIKNLSKVLLIKKLPFSWRELCRRLVWILLPNDGFFPQLTRPSLEYFYNNIMHLRIEKKKVASFLLLLYPFYQEKQSLGRRRKVFNVYIFLCSCHFSGS